MATLVITCLLLVALVLKMILLHRAQAAKQLQFGNSANKGTPFINHKIAYCIYGTKTIW